MAKASSLKAKLPRIAYIGSEALTPNHGTGMMFARHFEKYPRSKLLDVHFRSAGGKSLFRSKLITNHHLDSLAWKDPIFKELNKRISGKYKGVAPSLVYNNLVFEPIRIDWKKYGGPPELIYSTCFSGRQFAFLHHFYRNLPKKVPIIQHFLDLDLRDPEDMAAYYKELSPAIVELWALTKPIADYVARIAKRKPEMVQALQQPVTGSFDKSYREFSKDFRSLLIGNVWSGSAYESLRSIWFKCQYDLKELPAIQWAGHPRRFNVLREKNINFDRNDPAIEDLGLASDRGLKLLLKKADVAIVAFTGKQDDDEHYTKFSLPSRMGDYCAFGLPIIVFSRKNTAPARMVQDKGLGVVIDPANEKKAVRELESFLLNRQKRMECGLNGRRYLEDELDLGRYQQSLYERLVKIASMKIPEDRLGELLS